MTVAFDRQYELTIAKASKDSFFGNALPNAIIIRGMEIKFKVERSLESTPNSAEVEVYNLSDASRAEFDKKPAHVRLDVGYTNERQLMRLIDGDLMFAASKRTSSEIVTKFTVGDGSRAHLLSRITANFSAGITKKAAVSEIAKSMGLALPTSVENAKELLQQYSTGLTLHGPSRSQMDKVLEGTGFGWSIQDASMQLLRDQDTRAGFVELIDVAHGLIDSPEYCPPKQPGKPSILKFKVILRPTLIPGARVKVKSAEIDGVFRLIKVTHTGDFRDNDWYSECESNPT